MGIKRSANERDVANLQSSKRTRLSPEPPEAADSSDPSTGSVSEDSALQSSPATSSHSQLGHDSMSSESPLCESEESDSSSDGDSPLEDSSDDDSSDDQEEIITIGAARNRKKPIMTHGNLTTGAGDLRSRIEALLPQIACANEQLRDGGAGEYSMEDVDEDEEHIEMNLGLGVLEEKREGMSDSESEESSSSESSSELDEHDSAQSGDTRSTGTARKSDVMRKLLGREARQQKANIQELG